ncbi:Uncharacterized protein OBRU01_16301 [Operophtera brumata]|uniref:Monocarboxylate transporter n=1 Tax=Operophtera brumata TaxID=104452 RepID=A0A0L7L314_OPEBR|nr:Uncharacterized protein OBRU01_16301 [Operophtera brumata]
MVETRSYDITPSKQNESKYVDRNTINSLKSENDIVAHYEKDERPETPIERVKFEGLKDNDSICSEDEIKHRKLPPIPDGGWGWVVVVAAFLVSACADGLAFSFGLLHEEFANYFKASQSETSMIGSLFIATPLLAGPIMSALVDRYGCRVMTMIAGVLSTIGFLLASLSNSIAVLCLTFGFLSGLAMGILYVTAVVSVAFWFDKRRNLAVSLASCGIGFGTLMYSPLTHWLLTIYDWRNTIIILAGTLLNMCVCGALMRNPEWLDIKQKRDRSLSRGRSKGSSRSGSVSSRSIGGDSTYLGAEELKSLLESGKSPEYILATLASSIKEAEELEANTEMNAEQTYKRMHSAIHLPTFIQRNDKVPQEVIEKLMENKRLYHIILQNYPDLVTRRRSEANLNVDTPPADAAIEPAILPIEIRAKKPKTSESEKNERKHNKDGDGKDNKEAGDSKIDTNGTPSNKLNQNMSQDKPNPVTPAPAPGWLRQISTITTTDHHYLRDMPLYRNTMMHRGAMMSIPRYRLKASSLPDMYRNSMDSLDSLSDDETKWHNRVWQNIKSSFDIKMFSEFHFLMYNLSSLIFSIWFIPWINVTKTYAVCMIICGLSIAAFPLVITSYWGLACVSAVFGLSLASSYSYTPAILMELMPIDRFTVAYGLILLSQGLGHLIGPPIGAWLVVSGVCIGVIAYTKDIRICGTAPLLKEAEEAEKTENGENGPVDL